VFGHTEDVADVRDARIAKLEADLRASQERERQFGEIIAQQQTLIAAQQQLITDLQRRLSEQDAEQAARSAHLQAEIERLERQLLGPKTERVKVPPIDREIQGNGEMTDEERARRRDEIARKRRENALAKNAAMQTEEVEHTVPDAMKLCPKCGGTHFRPIDYESSSVFEYVPGHFVRHVHKRQKQACICGQFIVTAPAPPKLLVGGQYGFGFVAFLIVEKCADSIPIHRIEKRFGRLGIPISRSTMNDLVHTAAEVVRPLVDRLGKRIADLDVVLADETSMRLQDRPKRGFVWVFHGHDEITGGQLVLYVFAANRSGDTPVKILGGTEGVLVVDGYTGYNAVTDPQGRARAGCWSHLRRRVFEARSTSVSQDIDYALALIRDLFRVEHDATEQKIVRSPAHLALRTARSKRLVEEFFQWAENKKAEVLPKSPLGEALGYAINQRARLELFLSDARIPIHNNGSEARLRVIALARHNYLFFGHPRAGRNFAGLYSLVGSCIANGVEPTEYLTDVLPRIRDAATDEQLDALLPDRWQPLGPAP
jgi:transposase